MDLSLLIANDTAECVIKDYYTGKDTDIVITVYGPYSKEYTAALVAHSKLETFNMLDLICDLTVKWTNVEFQGKSLDCNKENVLKVYSIENSTLPRQIERFIDKGKNFLPLR
jgi:hypothetical protein